MRTVSIWSMAGITAARVGTFFLEKKMVACFRIYHRTQLILIDPFSVAQKPWKMM